MRRRSADEVAETTRRRLADLGEELARNGYPSAVALDDDDELDEEPVQPAPLKPPGRHSRGGPTTTSDRGVAWLWDRLPASLVGRVSLGVGHVAVLAVVAAVALAVTAFLVVRAKPTVRPVPQAHTSPASGPSATPAGPASPPASGATPSGSVVVDVAGKVRRPGVATLPAGSRVVDAIRRAGGARPGVDLTSLNLARVLTDGEQILVGEPAAGGVAASASSQPGAAADTLVNLNTATLDQLDTLPGVGPVTAQKILDWRTSHGSFTAIDELLEVDGIGEKTLADMAPHLTL
ncbi:MAG TPA: ComEA family DNA-binding protein [Marmoricola sp.]|nr:ComEA family DNA-binding protein [Marmoricola sp.]